MMSKDSSDENLESKENRFYEPRNWDKVMRIEEEMSSKGTI